MAFQTNKTIFTTNQCKICQSSKKRWDLNPQPLELELSPITTRPRLPPLCWIFFLLRRKRTLKVFFKKWAKPGLFLFIFDIFLNTLTNTYSTKFGYKRLDNVLGIRTRDRRFVGADETAELDWPPLKLKFPKWIFRVVFAADNDGIDSNVTKATINIFDQLKRYFLTLWALLWGH